MEKIYNLGYKLEYNKTSDKIITYYSKNSLISHIEPINIMTAVTMADISLNKLTNVPKFMKKMTFCNNKDRPPMTIHLKPL